MNRLLGMGGYDISIHALREEGDQRHQPCHHAGGISIHALREEGDSPHFFVLVARRVFLSTPSVRRATEPRMGNQQPPAISIHALREEGDSAACRQTTMSIISIHALREEGDDNMLSTKLESSVFLSTPSARRATHTLAGLNLARGISTHALREEGDAEIMGGSVEVAAISTHALREEGDLSPIYILYIKQISIHALREEGDCGLLSIFNQSRNFYPRPPRGGRPAGQLHRVGQRRISIHALREEGD